MKDWDDEYGGRWGGRKENEVKGSQKSPIGWESNFILTGNLTYKQIILGGGLESI